QLLALFAEKQFKTPEPFFRAVFRSKSSRPLELGNERKKRAVRVMRGAGVTDQRNRFGLQLLSQREHQSRFSNPWLARNQDGLTSPFLRETPARQHELKFLVASDEWPDMG